MDTRYYDKVILCRKDGLFNRCFFDSWINVEFVWEWRLYIYFRDPPSSWPATRRGLQRLSPFSQSLFLFLSSFGFLNKMSLSLLLEKDEKDTPLRPGKPTSYRDRWGFYPQVHVFTTSRELRPKVSWGKCFWKGSFTHCWYLREPFLLGPPGSQPELLLLSRASHPPSLLLCLTELGEEEPGFLCGLGIICSHFQWQE